ncbi:PAS domain S-box protein [Siculibacillus lacustris]|uniref:HTH-type transcriptional regulatory protein TyrR n=1 Tax=Siculibacillus lacustris TaxID=1549641 RepID=A0A4Q9VWI7_9HYPH|nr:sigma 54-interacting transcriptional regulator [Siculibacillus lacustris]TBW40690.1 PAS domain S-box protein [Siculibacillus lacustris]
MHEATTVTSKRPTGLDGLPEGPGLLIAEKPRDAFGDAAPGPSEPGPGVSIAADRVLDFEEIGDHLYDGVYVADGTGRTLYVNKSYQRITGIDAAEVIGRTVQELEADGLYTNAVTPEVLRLKKQVNSVGLSRRNGAKMLITGNPIFGADGEIKLVAVIEREITDLLEMQIELEATQEKIHAVEAGEIRARREVEHLRQQVMGADLVGVSSAIDKVLELVRRVADFDVTVLISGETGVGKEVVANEIHTTSNRRGKPFVKVNCAALPAGLLEAELFGYEKGAFTGAAPGGKLGLFELADKGSILLDEIGDMPLELQGKLLRVIQHKEMTRIGGSKPIRIDVRILAATNRDLRRSLQQGRFREDLYYRLNVFPIEIPPLRDRPDDVAVLARHCFEAHNRKYGKAIRIGREGLDLLAHYPWPGNVRELQNVVERIVLISDPYAIIGREQLAPLLALDRDGDDPSDDARSLKTQVDDLERRAIARALERHGSTRRAATALGIDQSTIVKKAKRLGLRICDDVRHQADEIRHRDDSAASAAFSPPVLELR